MDTIKAREVIGYSSTPPTQNGWYFVFWDKNDKNETTPHRVYLYAGECGLTWRWDEEDDPELIGDERIKNMLFKKA